MNSRELRRVLAALSQPRILVIGDLILDSYVSGDVSRISPEAPIPVLNARLTDERLGGAGNVAANLRSMEASVEVIGLLGDDVRGRRLRALLEEIGVETSACVVDPERPTIEKTRMMSGIHQMLRVDWEKTHAIPKPLLARLLVELPARVKAAQAVILSDYGKGLLVNELIAAVISAARASGIPVLVDPKGNDYARYRGATLVTPNRKEAEEAVGRRLASLDDVPKAAEELIGIASLDAAVITLGPDGMYYRVKATGESARVPTMARAVFDVTGAGDTVISHLALCLGAGLPLATAVHLANHAAGIVVGKRGAASTTREEMATVLGEMPEHHGKILRPEDVESVVSQWRAEEKRIVFTNGCFDILHAGHVDYLRFARSKGDVLIVGMNDDASVKRLKGPTRPVNKLEDRMVVLSALEMVDAVVPFGEDTPLELIERVTPHVLVKGQDWEGKGVVGREWVEKHGGQVHLAPLLAGRSTTSILERAKTAPPSC
ncbi:MAG: D-glycero-beta-D-manno-heptose-7-phosphate kinase [Planctomycetes bacterium]|nr:D-glycero-beta-D-manno-heptose-7-phosphate kinase [Planctomycetota bacterium]